MGLQVGSLVTVVTLMKVTCDIAPDRLTEYLKTVEARAARDEVQQLLCMLQTQLPPYICLCASACVS